MKGIKRYKYPIIKEMSYRDEKYTKTNIVSNINITKEKKNKLEGTQNVMHVMVYDFLERT